MSKTELIQARDAATVAHYELRDRLMAEFGETRTWHTPAGIAADAQLHASLIAMGRLGNLVTNHRG